MRRLTCIIIISVSIVCFLKAQEDPYDEYLREKIMIENPIYKPVIGFGTGVLNFHGDARNNYFNPLIGDNALKANISAFVDRGRYFKINFFLIYGSLSGNRNSLSDLNYNLNFKTDIIDIGVNTEYNFKHFFKGNRWITPFISAGIENLQFTPKGDLKDKDGNFYHYWSDGTIRNIPESLGTTQPSVILHRDHKYETDLRTWEYEQYGLGDYGKNTFSFPIDAGLDFKISERVSCRIGSSMHFTLTNFLDNVSSKGTYIKGDKRNDIFSYNYFTVHLDLFSQPKEKIIEKLYAEIEIDDLMLEDEDGDFILDFEDDCPGTPLGVIVDMRGCPLDSDNDGVPDYLDLEPNTAPGAWVDENGISITEEEFIKLISKREIAMSRDDINSYFEKIGSGHEKITVTEIPQKFKLIDLNNDGYISFEELLHAIDDYFDYKLDYKVEDIYELNRFFFAQ